MKLSEYAKQIGISYQTAWRHFKSGKIPYPTKKLPSGTVIVDYSPDLLVQMKGKAAVYARVSSGATSD